MVLDRHGPNAYRPAFRAARIGIDADYPTLEKSRSECTYERSTARPTPGMSRSTFASDVGTQIRLNGKEKSP